MDFGLWVEPEMVNADSDLYRQHPDWVMNFPDRPRSELRNQMILNLARNDVKEYMFGVLDKLASENNIRYFKWDMNRTFSEPGWPEAAPADQRKLWVEYVRNLYEIMDRLRARHPQLEIESCSGGGGRVDLGILQRVEEVWTSDNTEAFDRLRIQEGFTQAYAPKIMSAWVTDVPNMNGRSTPLAFRFLVAMQGALGIGANLNHWTEQDSATGGQDDRGLQAHPGDGADRQPVSPACRREPTMSRPTNTCRPTAGRPCCSPSGTRSNTTRRRLRSACGGSTSARSTAWSRLTGNWWTRRLN